MSNIIVPEAMYFGAPASLTIGGVEAGATLEAPKLAFDVVAYTPDFKNAKGPVAETVIIRKVIPRLEVLVNELTATKIGWGMPGSTAAVGTGGATASGHSQTLAADVAAGASVIKFPTAVALANPSAAADDIIDTATAHGFTAGQRVMLETKTGGTGLTVLTPYFVIAANLAATTLQVSLTSGGAAIDFSTDITAGSLIPAYTVGEFLKIGDSGETEIRAITAVGTSGAGGTGLTLGVGLVYAHDTGDAILQVVDAGTTIITWTPGRVPSSAYKDIVAVGPGLDGRLMTVTIFNALSTEPIEMPMDDESMTGLSLKLIGHYDKATPTVAPFSFEIA